MSRRLPPEIVAAIVAGALSGVGGALLFATLHALIIVPIWDRMSSGLVWGGVTGAAAGWAFAECYPDVVRTVTKRGVLSGVLFGSLLWISIAPVTGADAILRLLGLAQRYELLAVAVAVILAVIGGGTLGWLLTHKRRATIAGAVAGLLLVVSMAGPVPVGRSPRARNIFLAVLPAAILGGAAVSLLAPVIYRRLTRGRLLSPDSSTI